MTDGSVELWRFTQEDGAKCAHFAGLQLCGSTWTCPVCGPRIRQLRALDVDTASEQWLEQHGRGTVHLLTLTLPHHIGEKLSTVLGAVRSSFQQLTAGGSWTRAKKRFGLAHFIRAHDVTVGRSGWHPHIHAILFTEAALSAEQLEALRIHFRTRWIGAVQELGRQLPTAAHGVKLETARSRGDVVRYVMQVVSGGEEGKPPASVAMELTRGDLKSSRHAGQRTPWQVLQDYRDGRAEGDLELWREWERDTRRVHAIRWSRGLRQAVGLSRELSDSQLLALGDRAGRYQLATEAQQISLLYKPGMLARLLRSQLELQLTPGTDRELVASFPPAAWSPLAHRPGVRAGLLEAAELGGQLGVARYLKAVAGQDRIDRIDQLGYRSRSLAGALSWPAADPSTIARGVPSVMTAPGATASPAAGDHPARRELLELLRADQSRPDYATVADPIPEISSRAPAPLYPGDLPEAARASRRLPTHRLHRA